ncbi:CobW family GTP-binding protein [Echinicola salinicaeni]|uniref:CobW family GTP-binding protein n=1 Tax=Echinicola salinicaeni TaxID=2762757 RepID=UPI001644675B|nr:GTP-binding protein [Echinicola salinicaeni]
MSLPTPPSKIKVYLLTGFLGAGKTTVLNGLLKAKKDEENIIIENEFGKVSIDAHLVETRYCSLFEMNNGCICCSLDNELVETLASILNADVQPDNLFIEASGVADPGSIIALFRKEEVANFFQLQQVVAVVDTTVVEDWIEEIPEVSRQLATADLIVLNKKSQVAPSYLSSLTQLMQSINSLATVLASDHGHIPHDLFTQAKKTWDPAISTYEIAAKPQQHPLKSMLFEVETPIDREILLSQLTLTFFLSYHQLYRMKGLVWLSDSPQPHIVQTHGRQVHIAPLEGESKLPYPKSQLIFIGKGLERKSLQKIINKVLATKQLR